MPFTTPLKTLYKTWIKVCGITRNEDAIAAAELGADAIGLVFYPPSPRSVTVETVDEILFGIPEGVVVVALFVDPSAEEVAKVIETRKIGLLQFHGDESAQFCESFDMPYMKALKVGSKIDVEKVVSSFGSAELILLDTYDDKAPGGTGKTFDWSRAVSLSESSNTDIVLAGGLNPENISTAVSTVRPFGVDVSSGVEESPGLKDKQKIKDFIEGVRSVSN